MLGRNFSLICRDFSVHPVLRQHLLEYTADDLAPFVGTQAKLASTLVVMLGASDFIFPLSICSGHRCRPYLLYSKSACACLMKSLPRLTNTQYTRSCNVKNMVIILTPEDS